MVEPRTAKPGFHLGGSADDLFRLNAHDVTTNAASMNALAQLGKRRVGMTSQAPHPALLAAMHGLGTRIQGLALLGGLGPRPCASRAALVKQIDSPSEYDTIANK